MSRITAINLSSATTSAPVVQLVDVRDVTKRRPTRSQSARIASSLDRIVDRTKGNWISHDEVKRKLGL